MAPLNLLLLGANGFKPTLMGIGGTVRTAKANSTGALAQCSWQKSRHPKPGHKAGLDTAGLSGLKPALLFFGLTEDPFLDDMLMVRSL